MLSTMAAAVLAIFMLVYILYLRSRNDDLAREMEQNKRQKDATITMLDRIGEILTSELQIDPTLGIIADYIVEITEAEAGAFFLREPREDALRARVIRGLFPPLSGGTDKILTKRKYLTEKVKAEKIGFGEGLIGMVAEEGKPLLIADGRNDPRVPRSARAVLPIDSLMAAPLRIRGNVLGVFAVINKRAGTAFEEQDMHLLQALADQAAVTVDLVSLLDQVAEKQRIEQELQVARDFQRMLLPDHCPRAEGFDLAAFSAPAREVGGDFYDFIELGEGRIGIAIADVSGKGIPGALIMAMAKSVLRAEAGIRDTPRQVLKRVNERVFANTKESVFITMTYGVLDARAGRFRFARAGHEPLLTCSAGSREVRERAPAGIALGMVGEEIFDLIEEDEIQFEPDGLTVLYTDGAVEAMNESDEEYGHGRLYDSMKSRAGLTCGELLRGVVEDIDAFRQQAPQYDDITLVAIRALAPGQSASAPEPKTQALAASGG